MSGDELHNDGAGTGPHTPPYDRPPIIPLTLDDEGNIVDIGLEQGCVLGYDREEVLHRPFQHLVPIEDFVKPLLDGVGERPGSERYEVPVRAKCGDSLWYAYSARRRHNNTVSGYLIDITEKKELEVVRQALIAFAERLRAAAQESDDLASRLLNTPLNGVQKICVQALLANSEYLLGLSMELSEHEILHRTDH